MDISMVLLKKLEDDYNSDECQIIGGIEAILISRRQAYPISLQLRVVTTLIQSLLKMAPSDEYRDWVSKKIVDSLSESNWSK